MTLRLILTAALFTPLPALAAAPAPTPQEQVQAVLAEAGPGTRWGVVVLDDQGREVVSIDPEGRYMPASNTKLFTTAAAFWQMGLRSLEEADQAGRTSAYLLKHGKLPPDVVLIGRGDARLSSASDCKADCLARLVDQVVAATRRIGNVVSDDAAFEDERWSPGMSWNNIPTRSGTGVSALSLDNNEVTVVVTPTRDGNPPMVEAPGYYTVENRAETVSGDVSTIAVDRLPGSRAIRVTGQISAKAPALFKLGVDDPADFTAWRFAEMLRTKGVKVLGKVGKAAGTRRDDAEGVAELAAAMGMAADADNPATFAPPLIEDLTVINKESQNLHAELLLRRLGANAEPAGHLGSIAGGQKVITAMLTEAGLKPHQFVFADGSGMSTYNRVAPRGVAAFLRWTQGQPWGAKFRATLPVGGVDGTLGSRFKGTALQGRIFAKTGTINATNALAGFLTTKSGKAYTFAVYANDVPEDVRATIVMDKALIGLAESQ